MAPFASTRSRAGAIFLAAGLALVSVSSAINDPPSAPTRLVTTGVGVILTIAGIGIGLGSRN
jgi:hypothetical protein